MWTTLAHLAKWGMLVARTDPEQPKHKGMTYFVVDMEAPGVEVRPLYQITGEAEFNEVYFTDVRIPDEERLGEVGEGWRATLTTLMNERVAIGGGIQAKGTGFIGEAVKVWNEKAIDDPARKDELMALWVRAEVLRLTNIRASQLRAVGTPGPEGSIGKAMSADLNKDISAFTVGLLGAGGHAQARRLPDGAPEARHAVGQPAAGVPPGPGQLDRGGHDGDRQEHPRRARPRAAGRRPQRQGHPLGAGAPQLTQAVGAG